MALSRHDTVCENKYTLFCWVCKSYDSSVKKCTKRVLLSSIIVLFSGYCVLTGHDFGQVRVVTALKICHKIRVMFNLAFC